MARWCRGYWSSQGRVEKGWNWVAECNNLGGAYIRKNVFFLRWRGERYIPKNEAEYRNLILNQRIDVSTPFISRAVWKGCGGPVGSLEGIRLYGGLDRRWRTVCPMTRGRDRATCRRRPGGRSPTNLSPPTCAMSFGATMCTSSPSTVGTSSISCRGC